MTPTETVTEFLARINQRDPSRLAELLTDDHIFIDSIGNTVKGRDNMAAAWGQYFAFCPDYQVTAESILADGEQVAVIGTAGGTIAQNGTTPPENHWNIRAAFFALVRHDHIQQWRVYADNKPVYDILARIKST
jgi:uncharacterized protein (TIGR02246 family)